MKDELKIVWNEYKSLDPSRNYFFTSATITIIITVTITIATTTTNIRLNVFFSVDRNCTYREQWWFCSFAISFFDWPVWLIHGNEPMTRSNHSLSLTGHLICHPDRPVYRLWLSEHGLFHPHQHVELSNCFSYNPQNQSFAKRSPSCITELILERKRKQRGR